MCDAGLFLLRLLKYELFPSRKGKSVIAMWVIAELDKECLVNPITQ
jgi:hypothetical protein